MGRRRLEQLHRELSDRDHAILVTLSTLHFATTRHIERLHARPTAKTPLAAARAARRHMARLHQLGLVKQLERRIGGVRAGSDATIWQLTAAGARLAGITRGRPFEPGPTHLAHVLDVAELVVRLHEHARIHPVRLVAIETEPDCWRPIAHSGYQGRRRWLKPDLRATLRVGDHELHWFVELDRGTEHRHALVRKIGTYVAAWHDGGEQARAGVFPRVVWITPTAERATYIETLCRSTPGVPDGMFVAVPNDATIEVITARVIYLKD